MKVGIIDYEAGNVRSVQFAFDRIGVNPIISNSNDELKSCDKVIFPGVGEASSAMTALRKTGLDQLIPNLKQDVLGVCLGMQLMCNHTEEGDTRGLEIFNTSVKKFEPGLKVPHMGWNSIWEKSIFMKGKGVPDDLDMYFVHSYYAELCEHTIFETDYGIPFSSGLKKDNFYGFQFHPEKSGAWGEQLLKYFLDA